ncbi:MAG TPA: cytochrome c3 family protein [Burkholderiales bacterium]|nr:cytochrome c3 family protein [Burkholderiales bacterium]
MPQVFSPTATLLVKLCLIALVLIAAAAAFVFRWGLSGAFGAPAAPRQPIPFSHKHHAGDDGIDCRYCHASVDRAAFAGLPATEVCLTCHSQLYTDAPVLNALHESAATATPIAWRRVHDLPDFVYFDHGIHVTRGIACAQCHGHVEEMPVVRRVAPLTMQWCLECHRKQNIARLTDCSTCHR